MICGQCGKKIWFWQKIQRYDLNANPYRPAMNNVPFHIGHYDKMHNLAK